MAQTHKGGANREGRATHSWMTCINISKTIVGRPDLPVRSDLAVVARPGGVWSILSGQTKLDVFVGYVVDGVRVPVGGEVRAVPVFHHTHVVAMLESERRFFEGEAVMDCKVVLF